MERILTRLISEFRLFLTGWKSYSCGANFFPCRDIIKDLSVTLVPLQGYDKLEATDAEKSIKKVRRPIFLLIIRELDSNLCKNDF